MARQKIQHTKKFCENIKKYFPYAIRSAKSELKSEVADSYLNWLWWIIEPLCFMLIYAFVFGVIFGASEPYFASFAIIGQTMWQFFDRMLTGSVKLITNNRDLVTKVYIPKYILLLSKSFTYLFKMGISLILCFIIMAIQQVPLTWYILFMPVVIAVIYIVSFGISLFLMNYGVFLNDLANLTNIVLKMMFYLSGIFYNIRTRLKKYSRYHLTGILLHLNPIAFAIDGMRQCMLYGSLPSLKWLLAWLVIGLIVSYLGVRIIHKNENTYAKVI